MENKNSTMVLISYERPLGTWPGKGCRKFTDEQINFVLITYNQLQNLRQVAQAFMTRFNENITHCMVKNICLNPHKYRFGYIKPKSEYKKYDL